MSKVQKNRVDRINAIIDTLKSTIRESDSNGYFEVTSVHRGDLEAIGYNTSKITDSEMFYLAKKMAAAYVENGFWQDLEILAETYMEDGTLSITKKENNDGNNTKSPA